MSAPVQHVEDATQDAPEVAPLLEIRDLDITFETNTGLVHAVKKANLVLYPGQTIAIVGESGSGKSTTAHAIIGLLPGTGKVTGGSIKFDGREIADLSRREMERVRGREIGLVPQDPMTNLNPLWKVGHQVKEALTANHVDVTRLQRKALTEALVRAEGGDPSQLAALAEAGGDDDLYIGRVGKEKLLAALAEAGTSEDTRAALEAKIEVGSTTRAQAVELLGASGVEGAVRLVADLGIADTKDRIAGLLAEAGLKDTLARSSQFPHEYSGGMRQRALIAMGLAARPKLLIADEPTSALDVTVQRQILDHLAGLTRELGTAVLFITHDLGLAAERAEHLVVMYRGQVVESGPARQILASPTHPYTQRLVASAPSLASRRIQSAKERGETAEDLLAATGGDGVSAKREDVIVASHLVKEFVTPGKKLREKVHFLAVDDVSFTLKRGTTLAIVGESGSGKSTVANMVLDLLEPTSGAVEYEGQDIATFSKVDRLAFRRRVQPVFQNPYGSLDPMMSIYRAIEEPLRIHKVGDKASRVSRVRDLLDMVQMPSSTMRRFPNELSGGQRQRIAIARALALDPEVIVCDEAVSALDVLVQAQILTLLNDLQAELGLSYLFITHDLAVVRQIADEVVVMQTGKVVEHATTDEVFDDPKVQYTRDLLAAIPGQNLEGSQIAG